MLQVTGQCTHTGKQVSSSAQERFQEKLSDDASMRSVFQLAQKDCYGYGFTAACGECDEPASPFGSRTASHTFPADMVDTACGSVQCSSVQVEHEDLSTALTRPNSVRGYVTCISVHVPAVHPYTRFRMSHLQHCRINLLVALLCMWFDPWHIELPGPL